MTKRICVFCGSSYGANPAYEAGAKALGQAIAQAGYGLVYGGASVGLMGAVADAALEAGGEVIGVLPKFLADLELSHQGLTELYLVESMHERKAKMAELSDAFAILPGGSGTLEEMFEVWTWSQLGLHSKAIGLLNIDGFFDHLEQFMDHATNEKFLKPVHRDIMFSKSEASELVAELMTRKVEHQKKWVDRATS